MRSLPGDKLLLDEASGITLLKRIPEDLIPECKHEQTIRILLGLEVHY